jgi:hypothetical protein
MHHRLLIGLILLTAGPASAQVNIERLRIGGDSVGISGVARVSVTFASGNTEKQRGDMELRLDWLRPGTESFAIVSGDFDWTGGKRVSNRGLAHIRHILGRGARIRPEAFAQINYDKARNLDFRNLAGAGIRILLHSGGKGRASLGAAWMYEHEELDLPPGSIHPLETSHHRLSSFLTLSLEPREGVAIASTTYAQPRFDAFDDIRLLSQSRLSAQVLGPLVLDVTFDLSYDAEPPDDTESLDTSLRTGIGIRF